MKTILFFLLLLVALPAYAAQVSVELPQGAAKPGERLVATVYLDSEGERLNAYEGTLVFPTDLLTLDHVEDGGSIVTVWLTKPGVEIGGALSFSGITPGGYHGEHGFLFSAIFRAKEEGVGMISLNNVTVLMNDGVGTAALVTRVSGHFTISQDASSSTPETLDMTPPEPFVLTVAQSSDAFEGKKFLIFQTQDKGTGVARYDVCEGLIGRCREAQSPYVLIHGTDRLVRVSAIDGAGNARTATLFTFRAGIRYMLYILGAILLGGTVLFLFKRLRR